MTDREEDRRRVRALLAGDSAAFDVFFNEYFPRLYRFVLPRVEYSIADAQDICQETLLRALRRLSTYRGEAALYSWICQIAANEVADFWQRRRRDKAHVVFAEDDPSVQAVLATLQAAEADSPESHRYNSEIPRLVQATLDNLPPRFGDALEWKYLDGLTVVDVAHRLGVSTAAAQSVLQRARAAFREAFTAIGDVAVHDWLSPNDLRDPEV
jgi:RNA polymerase sigma-70 factor (ECF subfamily)